MKKFFILLIIVVIFAGCTRRRLSVYSEETINNFAELSAELACYAFLNESGEPLDDYYNQLIEDSVFTEEEFNNLTQKYYGNITIFNLSIEKLNNTCPSVFEITNFSHSCSAYNQSLN